MIQMLGASIIDKANAGQASIVVLPKVEDSMIVTTELLVAFCGTTNIVTYKWLKDSSEQGQCLPVEHFRPGTIKVHYPPDFNLTFSVSDTINNMNKLANDNKKLFDEFQIYLGKGNDSDNLPRMIKKDREVIFDAVRAVHGKAKRPCKRVLHLHAKMEKQISLKREHRSYFWFVKAILTQESDLDD
jgi:hypothetical protein